MDKKWETLEEVESKRRLEEERKAEEDRKQREEEKAIKQKIEEIRRSKDPSMDEMGKVKVSRALGDGTPRMETIDKSVSRREALIADFENRLNLRPDFIEKGWESYIDNSWKSDKEIEAEIKLAEERKAEEDRKRKERYDEIVKNEGNKTGSKTITWSVFGGDPPRRETYVMDITPLEEKLLEEGFLELHSLYKEKEEKLHREDKEKIEKVRNDKAPDMDTVGSITESHKNTVQGKPKISLSYIKKIIERMQRGK